jgi:hypothetical protein
VPTLVRERVTDRLPCYNTHVRSVIHFTSRAPSQLGDDLSAAGYRVFEALEISEVRYLCEHENIDILVIGPEIDDADFIEAQLRHLTIKLKPGFETKDVLWELSNFFPDAERRIQ